MPPSNHVRYLVDSPQRRTAGMSPRRVISSRPPHSGTYPGSWVRSVGRSVIQNAPAEVRYANVTVPSVPRAIAVGDPRPCGARNRESCRSSRGEIEVPSGSLHGNSNSSPQAGSTPPGPSHPTSADMPTARIHPHHLTSARMAASWARRKGLCLWLRDVRPHRRLGHVRARSSRKPIGGRLRSPASRLPSCRSSIRASRTQSRTSPRARRSTG